MAVASCGPAVAAGPRSGAPAVAYSLASSTGPCSSRRKSHPILALCKQKMKDR